MLPRLRQWFKHFARRQAEPSRVIVGSTGSGKSEGELVDLVRLGDRRSHAIVLLDGHGPLAFAAAGHWVDRGHGSRVVYEPLDATDRVLCWDMLPRSLALDPSRRLLDDAETRDELVQCLIAPRDLLSVADRPWTKEWLDAAIALGLAQPQTEVLPTLLHAFRVGTADYERLLRDCRHPDLAAKFRGLERIHQRNPVQYEALTGASRRLLEQVCSSEVIRLRFRPGPFDWPQALRDGQLLAFDGGGVRSRELKRTFFLLVSLQVIHAVRRHFARTGKPLPVVLVLEEAGAMGLVTPFVLGALQELRKAGLAVHVLTQSCLDFGDPALFQSVLANAPWQAWYQVLSPADQELGARAITNAAFDARAVQFTRERSLPDDGRGLTGWWRDRVRHVIDSYYKSPALQEQEYRTRLATLRVGERLVRERRGVRRERIHMLRAPIFGGDFEAVTRLAIGRLRQQPLYLPPAPLAEAALRPPLPDAAARLRGEGSDR